MHQYRGAGSRRSIRTSLLTFILTLVILYTALSVVVFSFFSRQALRDSVESNAHIVLNQSRLLMDERLYSLLSQFMAFCDQSALRNVQLSASDSTQSLPPQAYIEIDKDLSSLYTFNSSLIDSVVVYLNNGRATFIKGSEGTYSVSVNYDEWYLQYGSGRFCWQNLHPLEILHDRAGDREVYSLFQLVGSPTSRANGILLVNLKKSYFDNLFKSYPFIAGGYLAILSDDGVSYFSSKGEVQNMDDSLRTDILTKTDASGDLRYRTKDGRMLYVVYDTLSSNRWRVAAVIPESAMFANVTTASQWMILFGSLLALLSVALGYLYGSRLVNPILRLAQKVRQVKNSDTDTVFDVETNDEIGVLNDGIRGMLSRISELTTQIYTEMDQKRVAELSILQAQINPHFLYNTLFDIKQLCELGDTKTASQMVSGLAQFYRVGVSRGQELIPLESELSHVESYLLIQRIRYEDILRYRIDVPRELYSSTITKLTLQPLVENAIYHGIKPRLTGGQITISGRQEGTDILLTVQDDGVGIPPEQLTALQASLSADISQMGSNPVSYGLRNVHTRLRLQYGPPYGIEVQSTQDVGTTVQVRIPKS